MRDMALNLKVGCQYTSSFSDMIHISLFNAYAIGRDQKTALRWANSPLFIKRKHCASNPFAYLFNDGLI